MSTAQLIREGRLRLGLTEQQFADAVGVSRAAVQQWERGTTAPKRNNQAAVARKLGISVAALMEIDDHPPTPAEARYRAINAETESVREPLQAPYTPKTASPADEAAELVRSMSAAGQMEALAYLRFMAVRHGTKPPPA